jgi:hypothetical protein
MDLLVRVEWISLTPAPHGATAATPGEVLAVFEDEVKMRSSGFRLALTGAEYWPAVQLASAGS